MDHSRPNFDVIHGQKIGPAHLSGSNLPVQLTPLVGREQEVAAVSEILRSPEVRFLTLTGPGGVGKTRLGIEAAKEVIGEFADGVRLVSLAPVRNSDLVVSTVAQTLGLKEVGKRSLFERLKAYLRDKRLLLFLDNFEHVAEAAPVVTELLAAYPYLKALITSRASLRLSGEHEYPIPPLQLPDSGELPDPERIGSSESVALFVERARAARPDFELTGENARTVAEICTRLDGLPLAIELAATRVKLLPPETMLARLEHTLPLLTGGWLDMPARQRTLRSTLRWSHDLLDEGEQRLFRRLSVFAGGCTLQAAEAVCDTADYPLPGTLEKLEGLIDKSMVRREEEVDTDQPRFTMLETIQEYALEQLKASGEEETFRRAHAGYYQALAEEAEPKLTTAEQVAWLGRLEADHNNLRAALRHLAGRGEAEEALRLAGALWRFWYLRGHLTEGRRWLEETLTLSDGGSAALRAKALGGLGYLSWSQGDFERAKALFEESLGLSRRECERREAAAALNGLGRVASYARGDHAAARGFYEEALTIHRELGDGWGIAKSLYFSGVAATFQEDHAAAHPLLEEALETFREVGDREGIADSVGVMGMMALSRANHEEARSLVEEAREIMEILRDRPGIIKALSVLGDVSLNQGRPRAAHELYERALAILQDVEDEWWIAWCLEGVAGVATVQEQPARAARLFAAAQALRDAIGAPRPPAYRSYYEHNLAAARNLLDETAFAAAWQEGQAMTSEQAIEYALERRTVLESAAPKATPSTDAVGLTDREVEVLRLVSEGLTDGQVAERLYISHRTVSNHLRSVYDKLDVPSRAAAAREAVERGLI